MREYVTRNRSTLLLIGLFLVAILAAHLSAPRPERLHRELTGIEALVGPGTGTAGGSTVEPAGR